MDQKQKRHILDNISKENTVFERIHLPSAAVIILIILSGFIIYSNSFNNEFVFDDDHQITDNKAIRSFNNIPDAFTHNLTYYSTSQEGKFYRPIQTVSYMIDYFLYGLHIWGYHITNTLLHIAVCILLFYFFRQITGNHLMAAIISILYVTHPIHTEAVTYVSGRADSLATIFLLLMLILQLKYWSSEGPKKAAYYLLILAAFSLALLSKELAVMFPLLLMICEYCLRSKEKYHGIINKRMFFYLPLFLMIAIWFFGKNMAVSTESMVETPSSLNTRLITLPRVIYDYIRLSFFPINLHMEYKLPFPKSILQHGYFGPFIFTAIFMTAVWWLWKKGKNDINWRMVFFGLAWFLIALSPYLNIFFVLNAPFSEHWLYIPEMGLILSVTYLLFYITRRNELPGKIVIVLLVLVTISFSYLTLKQNLVWKDRVTFYTYTIKHSPYSAKAYNNLAFEYLKKGDIDKGKELLKKAVKIDPQYTTAIDNLRELESKIR